MNIYEYLKMDHEHVSDLFKQFSESDLMIRKQQIMAMIARELTVHAESEEATFYKVLEQFDVSKEDAEHGQKEHKDIEDKISLIMNATTYGSPWIKKVERLQEIVEHHVYEEEHSIFKRAREVLSEHEAYDLKEQMHYLKQKLLKKLASKKHPDGNPARVDK